MLFNDVIRLVEVAPGANTIGAAASPDTGRQVYADRQSVRQNEFYQAAAMGFRPEIMFIVRSSEYEGEGRLLYAGREYNIIRTYERPDEMTELVCQSLLTR